MRSTLPRDNVNINHVVPQFPFCKRRTSNRAGQPEHHLKGEMDITIHEATFMLFALADKLRIKMGIKVVCADSSSPYFADV